MSKIKSDGGSSDYYKIKLPNRILKDNGDGTVTIEAGDIIRYALNNDFNLGNIFKALVRWGKKEGIDYEYDRNKIIYFTDDHIRAVTSQDKKEDEEVEWFIHDGKGTPLELRQDSDVTIIAETKSGKRFEGYKAYSFAWNWGYGADSDIARWKYAKSPT